MNILLFKLRYIGDVLLTTPSIRFLRKCFPDSHITMVVNKGTEDVIKNNPHVNQILTIDRKKSAQTTIGALKEIRKRKYAFSLDFASGDRAAWISLFAGAPLRIGFYTTEGFRRWINNHQVLPPKSLHTVEIYLQMANYAANLFNVNADLAETNLELYLSDADLAFATNLLKENNLNSKNYIVAHTGCRYGENRWNHEHWANLINSLNFPVIFIGTSDDLSFINTILPILKVPAVLLAGKTNVLQSASIIKFAKCFIGHDSGPMHIASALGAPVAGFFGPRSDPVGWRPWCDNYCVIPTNCGPREALSLIRSLLTPKA